MKTSRRSFLAFLSTLPLARVLGVQGGPAPLSYNYTREMRVPLQIRPGGDFGNIVAAELERVSDYLPKLFERDDTFFASLEAGNGRERGGTRRRKGRGRSQRGRRG